MVPLFISHLPPTVVQLFLVLVLSFLVGLEREALKREGKRTFGGVRTFPLLGLMGYILAFLSNGQIPAILLGLVVVGAFMLVSYSYKLRQSMDAGITTEFSGLVVYLVGALIFQGHYWIGCTLVVVALFLLELKESLEGMGERISPDEVIAFTKFLMLSSVILPLVPNQDFTPFKLNPYRTWLVVVAVSIVSYGSYLLSKLAKGKEGVFLSGIIGGTYSSTVTTMVLAKRAADEMRPYTYSGSILAASGMMYLRILILVGLFNRALMGELLPSFLTLAAAALGTGWYWSRKRHVEDDRGGGAAKERNPLDLRAAFTFTGIFLAMVIITHLAVAHLGRRGVYSLAAIMGVTDVDPFIMGLTQATRTGATSVSVGAASILIATASNNVVKGIYAYVFAKRMTGRWSLWMLSTLALLGLLPLFWI
jgi:uncharacterized membrane protein (DUF4010 family)